MVKAFDPVYLRPHKSQKAGINDFFPSAIPSLLKLYM